LLFTAKPLYLAKAERERVAKIQKTYHKTYSRKRNRHTTKRSIKFAQAKIDEILIQTPLSFKANSYLLEGNQSRENYQTLAKMIDVLNNLKDKSILQIETHTDKNGSKKSNLKLSQQRADTLKKYIHSRSELVFISAIGYGEEIQPKKSKKEHQKRYLNINLKRIK